MSYDFLVEELARFSCDPLGFALFAFPWGEPDNELAGEAGLEVWQIEHLEDIRRGLTTGEPVQLITTTGHGVGKSAIASIIALWAMSTLEDTKGVVTANTENQLKTKTWAEMAKWYRLFIAKDLFTLTATALFAKDPQHEKTWRMDMVPWSERNHEAFAGMHNQGKRILMLFDEASSIPESIWEVTEGALTDENTQILWIAYGNPTRPTGRFRECFDGKFAHRWVQRRIDSRTVRRGNKRQINRWIEDYGLNSDFVRVRVLGEFPEVDGESFIPAALARAAAARVLPYRPTERVVLGVDVGRGGVDPSVIFPRAGLDAQNRPVELYFTSDLMELVTHVIRAANLYSAQMIFVDGGGVGGGVVDRLRQLGYPVHDVQFGNPSDYSPTGVKYFNKRAEIWGAMRDWLAMGAIPDEISGDFSLVKELSAPGWYFKGEEKIILEAKDAMDRRGARSPNIADALACTFALPLFKPVLADKPVELERFYPDYNPLEVSL